MAPGIDYCTGEDREKRHKVQGIWLSLKGPWIK